MKTIMIMGMGELGGQVLQLLLNSGLPAKFVTADIDEETGVRKTNLMKYVAGQMGIYRDIEFVKIDLNNIEDTASIINRIDPNIIYSAVTFQSWWVITTLPKEVFEKLDKARFGPWLPMHLTLVYKLMKAVKTSGKKPIVINSSFPDVTHNILSKIGLSPDMGIGNVHNVVQALKNSVADIINAPVQSVNVFLYLAHYISHYIPRYGTAGGGPYILKILVDGCDMSDMDHKEIFALLPKKMRRTGGLTGQILTAASAASIIRAVATNSQEILHCPGIDGLPGGYAARVGEKGAKVVLFRGLDMKSTIAVNEEGNRYDGIEKILEDGTVIFTNKEMAIMKEMLGYECKRMKIEDSEEQANELKLKYKEFAMKFK